jgi:hypothetical protein
LRPILALKYARSTDFNEFSYFCDVGLYTGFFLQLLESACQCELQDTFLSSSNLSSQFSSLRVLHRKITWALTMFARDRSFCFLRSTSMAHWLRDDDVLLCSLPRMLMQREQHKIAMEAVVLCLPGIAGSLQTIEIRTRHKRRQHGPAGKGNAGNLALGLQETGKGRRRR